MPSSAIARSPTGFADRFFCKVKYRDTFTLTTANQTQLAGHAYAGNSVYHVNNAAGAGTPLMVPTYGLMYQTCVVLASKISIRLAQDAANPGVAGCTYRTLVVIPSYGGLSIGTSEYGRACELPYARNLQFPCALTGSAVAESQSVLSANKPIVSHYMTTAKMAGRPTSAIMTEDNYGTAIGSSNPIDLWYWQILNGIQFGTGANAENVTYAVTITDYCMFCDRQDPAATA